MQVESVNAVEAFLTQGKKPPKVSICVVTYNQEKYIAQCLQSIVDQETDFDFEIIVGDDCSTDGTREIVREFAGKYPEKFRLFLHEKNVGAYKNFHFVHEQTLGQYVAHVDGDDYVLPGKLAAQAAILNAYCDCNAVWHRVDYFSDNGDFVSGQTADLRIFRGGRVEFSDAVRLGFVGVHSSLMYRHAAREIVSIDQPYLDLYFTWGLLSTGYGYFVDQVLGRYRVGAVGSISNSNAAAISKLTVKHAQIFLSRFPDQRKNFALWSITSAIIHGKNLRSSTFLYLNFFFRNIYFLLPWVIWRNLTNTRDIQIKWRNRKKYKLGEM